MKHLLFYGNCRDYTDIKSVTANYTATREWQHLSLLQGQWGSKAAILTSGRYSYHNVLCYHNTAPQHLCRLQGQILPDSDLHKQS